MTLLIDLTALEETGDYFFALDPLMGSEYAPVTVWHEGKLILHLDGEETSGEQAELLREAVLLCNVSEP